MKSVRHTITGMFILLLLGGGAVGTYLYCAWSRSDEQLAQAMHEKLAELAPGWNISFRSAHFDFFQSKVHLYDAMVPGDDPTSPVLEMAEVVLAIDRETLADPQPDIRHVRVVRPRVNLVRDADGSWNVARLPPLRQLRDVVPEFAWENGTITVHFDDPRSSQSAPLRFEAVGVHMVPDGKRRFSIRSTATFAGADELAIDGRWNIEERTWSMQGTIGNLAIDRQMLQLVAGFSDEFKRGLERCDAWSATGNAPRETAGIVDRTRAIPRNGSASGPARFDLSVAANVQFRFAKPQPGTETDYRLDLSILRGAIDHPAVGYALRELRGKIAIDAARIEGTDLSAQSGGIQIALKQCRILQQEDVRPVEFDLAVSDLPLDDRLYRLLPPESQRNWDTVHPRGRIDARLHVTSDGRQHWQHQGEITVREGTAWHEKFRYQIEQINGTIRCAGDAINMQLTGRSGQQPIKLVGKVKGKSPEAWFDYHIETPCLPIDAKLRAACSDRLNEIIDRLSLQGEVAGWIKFQRAAGPDQDVKQYIKGRLQHGAIRFKGFPYPLSDVSGEFAGAGESWNFASFAGRNGPAEVKWEGTVRPDPPGTSHLVLKILEARNIPCDDTLKGALTVGLRETWNELDPSGILHAAGRVDWSEGEAPEISLDVKFREGKLRLASLPIPFEKVQSDLSYSEGKVTIEAIRGTHEETTFYASGSADFPREGEWHLQLADLYVEDLVFNRTIRKALPKNLQQVIDAFDPHGRLSVKGEVAFRGRKGPGYKVTAAWDTTTVYTGNTINAGGIELKDLHGMARFQGSWDGEKFFGDGWIDLNSVKIFDRYKLAGVKGPITIADEKLIVGSKEAITTRNIKPTDGSKRLTAEFIDGLVGLDAIVEFGPPMRYHTQLTLTEGKLELYAKTYMPGAGQLAGAMNGWVDLRGEGNEARNLKGEGGLRIKPAALYDLPLIVAIFQALKLVPANNSAFQRADFDFDIRNSNVHFGKIDLVGDVVHLIGGGNVTFKGDVNLEFLSKAGTRQLAVPLIPEIIQLMTNGMVGVTVQGNLRNPTSLDPRITPFKQIDSAVRSLLGLFEPQNTRAQRR